ncbi:hypothetical protein BDC45DRAFT_574887 [Circinella umbellata]|nr:hypothetical protein BDC45DRAFT_574887 [Circinella umbellata]
MEYERAPLPQRKAKELVSNLDRVNYEIRKRGKNTKEKSTDDEDIFNKFEELENEYPDYITLANITSHSFIITFKAPLMPKYVNFKAFPYLTDVTYKAFPKDRYICSTVLYFPEIRKLALIFQAVIGGHFHEYFLALFSLYKIDFSSLRG